MPLKHYGVLKVKAINKIIGQGSSSHYEVHLIDESTDYRIAVNVKSNLAPSELLYLIVDDFERPVLGGAVLKKKRFLPCDFIGKRRLNAKAVCPLPGCINF